MYQNAHEKYLENEVLSASPQKIRKMLIDGAIRFCRIAINAWETQDFEKGLDATDRVRDIFTELIASTRLVPENQQIIDIYHFLNREVTIASFQHDSTRMSNVIRVLEVEQETWSMVCQQLQNGGNPASSGMPNVAPHYPINSLDLPQSSSSGQTSWEA